MKKFRVIALAGLITLTVAGGVYAAGWERDTVGWKYRNDDGTFQNNGWFQDPTGTYYYFNNAGYMLADTTTPDGYYVNSSGAWIQSNAAQSTYENEAVYYNAAGSSYKSNGFNLAGTYVLTSGGDGSGADIVKIVVTPIEEHLISLEEHHVDGHAYSSKYRYREYHNGTYGEWDCDNEGDTWTLGIKDQNTLLLSPYVFTRQQ